MLRSLLLTCVIAGICYSQCPDYSNIPAGYNEIKWGATPIEIKAKYPKVVSLLKDNLLLKNVKAMYPGDIPVWVNPLTGSETVKELLDPDPETGKEFFFINGKLAGVHLYPVEQENFLAKVKSIQETLGEPTKQSHNDVQFRGFASESRTLLWIGKETDVQVYMLLRKDDSKKIVAYIGYYQPIARATVKFERFSFPKELCERVLYDRLELGKGYENADWGAPVSAVQGQYAGTRIVQETDTSLSIYESIAHPLGYKRTFLFCQGRLTKLKEVYTRSQLINKYQSRSALIQKLTFEGNYGRPGGQPAMYQLKRDGIMWFVERFEFGGNPNTELSVVFMRLLQTIDPGNDYFDTAEIIYESRGI